MSLKSKPYYWVKCDGCGVELKYGEFTALDDAGDAEDVSYYGWTTDGKKHHCEDCPSLANEGRITDILRRRLDEWQTLAQSSAPDYGEMHLWAADAAEAMQFVLSRHDAEVRAEAWDEGFASGKSHAMRHMSDEPNLSLDVPNPYRTRKEG